MTAPISTSAVDIWARRPLFNDEHEEFRRSFAGFVAKEMSADILQWETDGIAPRELFIEAGRYGFLGMSIPQPYGGGGINDFRFSQVIAEELAAAGIGGAGASISLHNDITTPYFVRYCNDEQAARWLPGIASGHLITAIAMTEPGTGSDLASIATTAERDGDVFVLNGSKTFITNGIKSDLVIVVAKTDPKLRHAGMSLLVVERGTPGFTRGRKLDKIGLHSQDTAELFFSDCRVPATHLLGDEGSGFTYLTSNLAQERMLMAVQGAAAARAALCWTIDYVKERRAFGQAIASFQNTKFVLAEVKTALDVAQAYVDQSVERLNAGTLSDADAAQAKYWCSELQQRTIDRCLQLFGGYGYITEYPIARAFADARISTIAGGTSEIMKTIIAKDLGL